MRRALLVVAWLALPLFVRPASAQEFIGRGSKGATHAGPSANAQLQARDMIEQAQAAQRAALPPLCDVTELVAASQAWANDSIPDPPNNVTTLEIRPDVGTPEYYRAGLAAALRQRERAEARYRVEQRWRRAVLACSP